MTIDELIARLQEVKAQDGNLEVFASNFTRGTIAVDENDGQFPASWNMPAKFVVIGTEP